MKRREKELPSSWVTQKNILGRGAREDAKTLGEQERGRVGQEVDL